MNNQFIHIRNYTQYSLSIGALRISDLINYCIQFQSPAIGISDFNNLFGSMEFSLECKKNGIQPILACNVTINDCNYIESELILIAKNEIGFQNLSKLVSNSYLQKKKVSLSLEDLKFHANGLICLTGGMNGLLKKQFDNQDINKTSILLGKLRKIFYERLYLEIQREEPNIDSPFNEFIINCSLTKNIPLVATNENYFLKKSYHETHDALICISQQKYIESEDRKIVGINSYLKTPYEMSLLFKNLPQAITNTLNLAKCCSFIIEEKKSTLPKIYNTKDENSILREKSESGLQTKLREINNNTEKKFYQDRLQLELDIITKMGYSGYFLIVADFIQWAKKNKIPVGPGRGSGAGSLVAWCLTITNLDPIRFGLIFERFLNPERISMPDFDIDFCMEKRDEVIKYVQKKYDKSRVAQIITFGSFQARAALRDVGRVMQMPYSQVDSICKLVPYNPAKPISLKESVDNDEKLKQLIKSDEIINKLFKISMNLEGLLRHSSTHAAGVVISDKKLIDLLPLYRDPKSDLPVTQFTMKYVEKAGLVKFDFLGLKTLTVIEKTCSILRKKSIFIDIDNIDLNDQKTFKMLQQGKTVGVFQFDGKGMRETICQIKPTRFEDLIAIVSLYRPGPMDNIPTFIKRKNNGEKFNYLHPELKDILDETYGIMVYQEQVMQIAQKLAGFSLAKADLLRRAMGKKIKSEMKAQKKNFIEGCKKNLIKEDIAENLYNEIEKFAGYGFNKSHAAAYALIAFQTAFLKTHYPLEFLCASMQCDNGNIDKISIFCKEIRSLGFKIFNPDVNYSQDIFEVCYNDNGCATGINYSLSAIKNIGENSIKKLVLEREKNGKFKSILDLLKRLDNSILNKRQLESLIYSGSMNSIESNGSFLEKNITKLLKFNSSFHENKNLFQQNLFSNETYDFVKPNEYENDWDVFSKLKKEHDSIGFYLSNHPLEYCKEVVDSNNFDKLESVDGKISKGKYTKTIFNCLVVINEFVQRISKFGKKYAFLNLSDDSGAVEVVCFSDVLTKIEELPQSGDICKVKLELIKNQDQDRLILADLDLLDIKKNLKNLDIQVDLDSSVLDFKNFKNILKNSIGGENQIVFCLQKDNFDIKIESDENFKINLNFLNKLKETRGIKNVIKKN